MSNVRSHEHMTEQWAVAFAIQSAGRNGKIVGALRRVTSMPVVAITAALKSGLPIDVRPLFGASHDENERTILAVLLELEGLGARVAIYISGRPESKEYLLNILQRHYAIAYDVQMETELELGEPSEEATAWAAGNFTYPRRGT